MMMRRFNNFIADRLASFMATMLLFWLLLILDVAGAIVDPPSNTQGWLLWGVSILFQSIALPVIALVSNKQGERMERVLRETHDAAMSELSEIKQMHKEVRDENAEIRALVDEMHHKHIGLIEVVEKHVRR